MSLEEALAANTAALNANTAALLGDAKSAGSTASKSSSSKAAATKNSKPTPKHSLDDVTAAVTGIKDDFGLPEAKKILVIDGKPVKLAELKPENYDEIYAAAIAKHEELSAASADDDM